MDFLEQFKIINDKLDSMLTKDELQSALKSALKPYATTADLNEQFDFNRSQFERLDGRIDHLEELIENLSQDMRYRTDTNERRIISLEDRVDSLEEKAS